MTDLLKEVHCFLFDMDGTIYLGGKLLPGVQDFLGRNTLTRTGIYGPWIPIGTRQPGLRRFGL